MGNYKRDAVSNGFAGGAPLSIRLTWEDMRR
jgi:hypothetical protein